MESNFSYAFIFFGEFRVRKKCDFNKILFDVFLYKSRESNSLFRRFVMQNR